MSRGMAITIVFLIFIVGPLIIGTGAGVVVRPGGGYRAIPAVAWICCLGIVGLVLVVAFAMTPENDCGGTGCDTGYGLGAILGALIMYVPALLGVWLGRRVGEARRPALEDE